MAENGDEGGTVPLALYRAALDEIWHLRRALAYEARVVEAQTLDVKALGKGRREILERQVGRMREAADGRVLVAYAGTSSRSLESEYERATGRQTLTRFEWESELPGAAAMQQGRN